MASFMNEVILYLEKNCASSFVTIVDYIMVNPKLKDQMRNVSKTNMDEITGTIMYSIAKKQAALSFDQKDSLIRFMSHLLFGKYEMSNDVMNKLLKMLLTLSAQINTYNQTSTESGEKAPSGNLQQKLAKQAINCIGNLYNKTAQNE